MTGPQDRAPDQVRDLTPGLTLGQEPGRRPGGGPGGEQGQEPGRALIVGGGGFLGTNLGAYLADAGLEVVSVSRSALAPAPPGVTQVATADVEDIAARVAGVDTVFHLAHGSSPASSLANMQADLMTSMGLTFRLIEACIEAAVPLVYLSSGGAIYGPGVQVPTHESQPTDPISGYGISKLTAEKYLEVHARLHGLRYRALRVANPFGPWQLGRHGQGVIGTWLQKALAGAPLEIWGDGTVVRDYVYVGDVVTAIWQAARYDGRYQIFNIGSGQGRSLNEILAAIEAALGADVARTYHRSRPADVPVTYLDISRARAELGWAPQTEFSAGIETTLRWMRAHMETG